MVAAPFAMLRARVGKGQSVRLKIQKRRLIMGE